MEISASDLLKAIKAKTLKAIATRSTSGDRVSIELRADGKAFAVLDCGKDQRARATFGKTVYLLPATEAEGGLEIKCHSEVDAVRLAMELDNCLSLAFVEAMGAEAAELLAPTLGIALTMTQQN